MPKPIRQSSNKPYEIIREKEFNKIEHRYQFTNEMVKRSSIACIGAPVPEDTNVIRVEVDEYHINSDPEKMLYTGGLGPCIGLLMYSHDNETALLAHFLPNNATLESDLSTMLDEYMELGGNLENTQAIMFGGNCGNKSSIDSADTIINQLQQTSVMLDTMSLFPRTQTCQPRFTLNVLFDSKNKTLSIDIFLDQSSHTITLIGPEYQESLSP